MTHFTETKLYDGQHTITHKTICKPSWPPFEDFRQPVLDDLDANRSPHKLTRKGLAACVAVCLATALLAIVVAHLVNYRPPGQSWNRPLCYGVSPLHRIA